MRLLPALLIALLSLPWAATGQPDSAIDSLTGSPAPAPAMLPVLVVHDTRAASDFKDGVVARLREALGREGYTVAIADLRSLRRQSAPGYSAVVVLDAVEGAKLQPGVDKFIRSTADNEKQVDSRVLVATVSGENWREKRTDVSAITGASQSISVEGVVGRIMALVKAALSPPAP
jgi:hypothetical protein